MFNRLVSQTEPIYRKDESIDVKKLIIGLQFFVQKKILKIYRRVMICKIMLSWFSFRQLDILRLGYLTDRCCVVWHWLLGCFRFAKMKQWANKGSISVLKTALIVPFDTTMARSLALTHKLANKTNLINSISLSPSSLFPHPLLYPLPTLPPHPLHTNTLLKCPLHL